MLELDDNYFKEEERCGFKIPSMMKRVWAVEMDVLTHIDRYVWNMDLHIMQLLGQC